MTTFRRILTGSALVLAVAGFAGADTINAVQVATGGTIGALASPSIPAGAQNTGTASVSGFNQAAANAAIVCPSGFTCSTATLYEIDLGILANTSGSLNISNLNGSSQLIGCLSSAPGSDCTTGATTGIGAIGTASLAVVDPNSKNKGFANQPTFTVATNFYDGAFNELQVASGDTPESGTDVVNIGLHSIYNSTTDGTWSADSATYSVNPVNFNLTLSGASQIGSSPTGVSTNSNVAAVSSGQITVDYDFSYTETNNNITPEPATMALMGGALLGLGLISKKRFKKS